MNPLLIIHTWQPDHDNGANDACRGTYLYTWGTFLTYRFVFDRSRKFENLRPDEISVDAESGIYNTSFKTRLAIQWAYEHGFTHVVYVPTDCYIIVPRLLRSMARHTVQGHDYWGFHTYDEYHIGGGSGYTITRKAMEAVLAFNVYADYEDRWIGAACKAAGIPGIHDEGYRSIEQPHQVNTITLHLSEATGVYDPEVMKNLHMQVIRGATFVDGEGPL
jgi:hypothetical protein